MSHFSRIKPEKRFFNCVVRKFFENFSSVNPRSTRDDASVELPFVEFGNVGSSEVVYHPKKLATVFIYVTMSLK